MGGLGALLDQIRAHYVDRLAATVADHEGAIAEPALRDEQGVVATEGQLALGMRVDVVIVEHGKRQESLEVDPTTRLSFEPISFDWEGGLDVELRPFCWNGLSLLLSGDEIAPAALVRWFKKWFDEDDERAVLPNGLCGVVHFLSDPRPTNGGVRFEADFGSAPVEAFEELLDSCREAGAQSVCIESE